MFVISSLQFDLSGTNRFQVCSVLEFEERGCRISFQMSTNRWPIESKLQF